jgi:AcrR family transcriptional regulator
MRQRITETALAIFQKEGVDAVTMRSVAREMCVSVMGVYTYFDSRSALLLSLWNYVFDQLDGPLQTSIVGQETPEARLISYADAFMRHWETHPDQYRLVYVTKQDDAPTEPGVMFATSPGYSKALLRLFTLIKDVAGPDASVESCRLAVDRGLTQVLGFVHYRVMVVRYPMANVERLRTAVLKGLVSMVKETTAPGAC